MKTMFHYTCKNMYVTVYTRFFYLRDFSWTMYEPRNQNVVFNDIESNINNFISKRKIFTYDNMTKKNIFVSFILVLYLNND